MGPGALDGSFIEGLAGFPQVLKALLQINH